MTIFFSDKNLTIPVARIIGIGEGRTILEWNDSFLDLDDLDIVYSEDGDFMSKENLLMDFSKKF